ncbi:MAG: hypothetical protein KDD50_01925 [Bdellovibrionales bacterium]|nr:hypothetical protein [Bdellovibrionales bacterium]
MKLQIIIVGLIFFVMSQTVHAAVVDFYSFRQAFLEPGKIRWRAQTWSEAPENENKFTHRLSWGEVFKGVQIGKNEQTFYQSNGINSSSTAAFYGVSIKQRDLYFKGSLGYGLSSSWQLRLDLPVSYRQNEVVTQSSPAGGLLNSVLVSRKQKSQFQGLIKNQISSWSSDNKYRVPTEAQGLIVPEVGLVSLVCLYCKPETRFLLLNKVNFPVESSYRMDDAFTLQNYREDFLDMGLGLGIKQRLGTRWEGFVLVNYQSYFREGRPVRLFDTQNSVFENDVDMTGEIDPGDVLSSGVALRYNISSAWSLTGSYLGEVKGDDVFYGRQKAHAQRELYRLTGQENRQIGFDLNYLYKYQIGIDQSSIGTGLSLYQNFQTDQDSHYQAEMNISYVY